MSKRYPRARWVLPITVHPTKHVDWCIPVPDDPFYRAAFWGALQNLASATNWQDDAGHAAKDVAQVWRNIIDDLERCKDEPRPIIYEEVDNMGIRVDCDCRVWVTCCDGTEKELVTVGMLNKDLQPNSAVTPPAGGTSCNQVALDAGSKYLLPFPVNSGDTLLVSNTSGGWADGGAGWTYANGVPYVFAHPVGSPYHWPGDPDATAFHGQLCYLINGNYYAATGGAFTVPGGITNAQCELVGNFASYFPGGAITFDVCYTNNATPPPTTWCALLDFTLSDYGFVPQPSGGSYVPGVGFTNGGGGGSVIAVYTFTGPATITYVKYTYHVEGGSMAGCDVTLDFDGVGAININPPSPSTSDQSANATVSITNPTHLRFWNTGCGSETLNTAVSLELHGTGVNPFGTSNC